MQHENQRHAFAFMAFRLDHGRDADFRRAENGGDLRQRPRTVHDVEPEKILRNGVLDRHDRPGAFVRHEWRHALFAAGLQIERRVRQNRPSTALAVASLPAPRP